MAVSFLRDKPLPNGRMRDELVRLSIRTLGKDNGHEHIERTLGVRMFVGLRERETRSNPVLSIFSLNVREVRHAI